ncbi:MAG: DnaA ATPase domain-containing protein [Mycoplasma sp.]
MSDYKKEITERALKDKNISNFEITVDEINQNILDIYKIYMVEDECSSSNFSDKCGSNGFHFKLVKDSIGKISLQSFECPKNKKNLGFRINSNIAYSSIDISEQHQLLNKSSLNINDEELAADQVNLLNYLLSIKRGAINPISTFISGDFGVGKTFFILALANEMALQNKTSAYILMNNFCLEIMQNMKLNNSKQAEVFEKLKEVDILIFDDLGSEKFNNYIHSQIIIPLLNYRFASKKQTFFLSKYNLNELKRIYNSLSSDPFIRIYIEKIEHFSKPNIFRLSTKLKKSL